MSFKNDPSLASFNSWYSDWSKLRVAVLGASMSGFSVADTLCELGSEVLVLSESASEEYLRLLPVIGAQFSLAAIPELSKQLEEFAPDLVVASPGFSPSNDLILKTKSLGIPLWGDVELAWRVRDKISANNEDCAEWILVTGTNGKTTTTRLAATMLVTGGLRAAPVGNIGTPVLDAVRDPAGFDVLVVELSSHQLWYLEQSVQADPLSPLASVCLNLAPDHLKWHGSFDAYRAAKSWVYNATKVACVYNKSDLATLAMVEEADVIEGARAIGFDLGSPAMSDFGVVDGILVDRAFGEDRRNQAVELSTIAELSLNGLSAPHIVMNILAAAALSRAAGVSAEAISLALDQFRLDPHRIELVAVSGGVSWVNDSKATNPHAAESSLKAYPGSIWIAGGLLKGVDIRELVRDHGVRARAVVLIGSNTDAFKAAFAEFAPDVPVVVIDDRADDVMLEAVKAAASHAVTGSTVLLAPAAASFDQFKSFEDRGDNFKRAVSEFVGGDLDGEKPQLRAD